MDDLAIQCDHRPKRPHFDFGLRIRPILRLHGLVEILGLPVHDRLDKVALDQRRTRRADVEHQLRIGGSHEHNGNQGQDDGFHLEPHGFDQSAN